MYFPTVIFSFLLKIVICEIIVKQHTICNIEELFAKFLINSQLKCINIHKHEKLTEASDEISKCLWNHFEEKLKIPVSALACDSHIFVGVSYRHFEANDFSPFSKILLINTDLTYFNLHSIFLQSLNVFEIKMNYSENYLEVLPELISLINNKTIDWTKSSTKSNQDFLNEQNFIRILLRNDYGIKELRASYTNCPPYVIRTESMLDGIEIRIINEIAKNWKISYLHQATREMSNKIYNKKYK